MLRIPAERALLALVLTVYGTLGALFAWRTPPWQAPDEPAHYYYIQQVSQGTLIPVIQMGDWDQAYLDALKASGFKDEALLERLATVRYENHQPPLYYWLMTPLYSLSGGSLLALRLGSVALGALVIVAAWAAARLAIPSQPTLAPLTAALVAVVPQHVAILASVNNDALALALVGGLLALSLGRVRGLSIPAWWLGLLMGLALISKTTTYFMGGVATLALLLTPNQTTRHKLRSLLIFGALCAPFALLWWGRNVVTYGWPDFLGLGAHDAVVVGQLRTAELLAQVGGSAYLQAFVQTTFESFWGQFGWMAVPMRGLFSPGDALPYQAILALIGLGLVGALWTARAAQHEAGVWRVQVLMLTNVALTLAMYLYYNSTFVQFQGRYLFPALIPLMLGLAYGLLGLGRALRWPHAAWAAPMSLAILSAYLAWRVLPGALG
ncbi:MAG: glycosyltransferase family 39 protein [Anaerolineae bacterium]|nr:glycosyltransferase family 39 protein [Anaerolineae bacterium]MDW8171238.1 glycosyltransferase family 39 protein [Anaerolineae bacterium]